MTKKLEMARDEGARPAESPPLTEVIGRAVLDQLGLPDNFLRVRASQLWAGQFRVNVFVGSDATSARVAHTYFLAADAAGKILNSVPAITRQY
jgi:hypothetical protein